MKSYEYHITEQTDKLIGEIQVEDLMDAIGNSTIEEYTEIQKGLREYNHVQVGVALRNLIARVYDAKIQENAEAEHDMEQQVAAHYGE